jgi:hypothetical protein
MRDLSVYLPKTEAEADERLLRILKEAVEERGWSICLVKRMLMTQLRDMSEFDEKTWPLFLASLTCSLEQFS